MADGEPKLEDVGLGDATVFEDANGLNTGLGPDILAALGPPKMFVFVADANGDAKAFLALGPVGAPKMFAVAGVSFDGSFVDGAKGFGAFVAVVFAVNGFFISKEVPFADELLCWPAEGGFTNRTCLLLCEPPREAALPPLPVATAPT